MRVLLASHTYPPEGIAGVERYTQSLATALVAGGDTVGVVARSASARAGEARLVREQQPDAPAVYRLLRGETAADGLLSDDEALGRLAAIALVESAPDVLHVNHLLGLPPQLITLARRLLVPVVLSLHDFYFACPLVNLQKLSGELCAGPRGGRECATTCFADDGRPRRWELRAAYFRQLLSVVDLVTCPSRAVAAYFEALAPEAVPIRVVPLGISIAEDGRSTPPEPSPRAGLRIAYLGSVGPRKGVHRLVEAIALAGLEAVELGIFGRVHDPAYADALRVSAAGAPSIRLHLHGDYEPSEIRSLLADADVAVVPSQVPEVYPLAPREALACGVPILVGRLGGLPEAVDEGRNGLTFDAERPEELAALLRQLDADRERLEQLRRGALATPVLGASEHGRSMRAMYEEVIHASLHRPRAHEAALEKLQLLHAELADERAAALR